MQFYIYFELQITTGEEKGSDRVNKLQICLPLKSVRKKLFNNRFIPTKQLLTTFEATSIFSDQVKFVQIRDT